MSHIRNAQNMVNMKTKIFSKFYVYNTLIIGVFLLHKPICCFKFIFL